MGVAKTTNETTPARHTKLLLDGLAVVAAFLNAIGPRTTPRQWDAFRRKLSPYSVTSGPWMSLDEAKTLRRDLDYDLGFLRADTPLARPFDNLVDRLNGLHMPMVWHCEPLAHKTRPHDPSQATIELRWKDGTTGRWTIRAWPGTPTFTDYMYVMLGKALETGLLARLRACRHCGKYLVAVRGKRREVCRECKDAYQNQKRAGAGYWKDLRQRHRALLVERACKRMRDGETIDEIREATGLPRRVVAQVFEGHSPKTVVQVTPPASRPSPAETPEAIAARLRPVIAAHYKRMAELDQKKPARRVPRSPTKKR